MSKNYDLLIVDANSLIYRTYFASARTDLSVQGQAVGATYGFFNILLKALQSFSFANVAFCWDVAKKTFRNEIFADYKATRESMPEDLKSQIPLVQNALQLADFCQLGWQGYEADDLIGSLSYQAMAKNWQVLVLSSDKDDLQLISEQVSILMPKGAGVYELWDKEKLQTEYGVSGDGWLQMKALMGDSSDNIPGVKGIGIKGASSLISKYKTIANLDAHLEELSKSQRQKIVNDHDNMLLSLELSRIKCDLEVVKDWHLLKNPGLEQVELANILSSLQFKSLINRYGLSNLATQTYNLQALGTADLLLRDEEQAILSWQAACNIDFFTKETEKNNLDWQQVSKLNVGEANLVCRASKLLREYLILNYPYLAEYGEMEREVILHLLESIKNEAKNASPYLSLEVNKKAAILETADMLIVKLDTLDDLADTSSYFYLPYLKLSKDTTQNMLIEVSDSVTDGLLWTNDKPQILYQLDKKLLRELLLKLQKMELAKLSTPKQTYEQAAFNTWQLKELLKELELYDLRSDYKVTLEAVSVDKLVKSQAHSNLTPNLKSATAYLDLDLLAYSLGCLKTELYTEFIKQHKKSGFFTSKELSKLLVNSLLYLDIAYAHISFSHAATLSFRIEQALVPILAEMENTGIFLDQIALNRAKELYQAEMDKAERQLIFVAGHPLNLNSPEQVSNFLFEELNLASSNMQVNKSGFISTSNENLQELANSYPLVQTLLDYRKYQKLLNFAEGLKNALRGADSRVSTEYLQMKTATGRLSSQNPNLQNIPVRADLELGLREVFIAEEDRVLLDVDYSQIELRIMAALANDENMLQAFKDGRDIHREVASHIFHKDADMISQAERSHAKAINFSLIYGATAFGTAKRLGISFSEAKLYLKNYFAKYAKIKTYMDYLQDLAKEDDYVETIFARRRYLGKLKAHQLQASFAEFSLELDKLVKIFLHDLQTGKLTNTVLVEQKLSSSDKRIIINTPVQGTGADIIKLAMLKTVSEIKSKQYDAKLLLQVHDELLFSVSKAEVDKVMALVKDSMENLVDIGVKLQVQTDYGTNWAEIH